MHIVFSTKEELLFKLEIRSLTANFINMFYNKFHSILSFHQLLAGFLQLINYGVSLLSNCLWDMHCMIIPFYFFVMLSHLEINS